MYLALLHVCVVAALSEDKIMNYTILNKAELLYMHERIHAQEGSVRKSLELSPQRQAALESIERRFVNTHEVAFRDIESINEQEGIGKLLYQGDIVLKKWQLDELVGDNNELHRWKRQAFRDHNYPFTIWPDGEVYYSFHNSTSDKAREVFRKAAKEWQRHTCLNFFENDTVEERIEVVADSGCWSYVGKLRGVQQLSINTNCEVVGIAVHEIGHALGFLHTHSRHDRDQYIMVDLDAVEPSLVEQFNKEPPSINHNYGIPYDYGSVMHYNSRCAAKDNSAMGDRTMVPLNAAYVDTLGSHILSFYEKLMMNIHYNCLVKCKIGTKEMIRRSENRSCKARFPLNKISYCSYTDEPSRNASRADFVPARILAIFPSLSWNWNMCCGLNWFGWCSATTSNAPSTTSTTSTTSITSTTSTTTTTRTTSTTSTSTTTTTSTTSTITTNSVDSTSTTSTSPPPLPSDSSYSLPKCEMGGFPNPRNCTKCVCPSGYGGRLCNRRPKGCGRIMQVFTAVRTFEDHVGQGVSGEQMDFEMCNYWLKAPKGRKIEVTLVSYDSRVATDGCYYAGIEIKTQKDQRATGYRICSSAYKGWVFKSESNLVPIITYSRVGKVAAKLQIRMV